MSEHAESTEPAEDERGERDPLRRAVDLMVFAPLEALVELTTDGESLADRGRQRVGLQLSNARFLGQMAVTFGVKEVRRRTVDLISQVTATTADAEPDGASRQDDAGLHATADPSTQGVDSHNSPPRSTAPSLSAPPEVDALIPGYDDLSASQVVRLLPGLSPDELMVLVTYESASRGRRTIINRASQLAKDTPETP